MSGHQSDHRRLPPQGIVLLLVVALGWGVSWTVIKHSLSEIAPLSFRGVSAVVGGVLTLALVRLQGVSLTVPRPLRARLAILALFNIVIWNVLATYGVKYLPSGRAALLAYTMPLWCVPLSIWLLGEALTLRRGIALVLGFAGVAVLIGDGARDLVHAPVGVLLMVGGAMSWAVGLVLFKRWSLPMNTASQTGWQMLVGGAPLLLAAFVVDGVPDHLPGFWSLFGLAFSVLVTFMLCNWAWNRLVLLVPVSVSSLSSLLTPLVGVVSGAIFLGERPGWPEFTAAALILGAVAVVSLAGRPQRQP